jgi:hypothetical protein
LSVLCSQALRNPSAANPPWRQAAKGIAQICAMKPRFKKRGGFAASGRLTFQEF